MNPFRFGVLTKGASSRKAWLDLLAEVEDAGVSSLHLPTHSTPQYSPAVALADAAARTSLRIGTLVQNNDLQHPALLAREATTLALLSEGRFELGIGAGWMERDYRHFGLPLDPGGERVSRLAEAIEVLRRCWSGREVSFHGKHYTVDSLQGLQGPPVPLLVGAGGGRMLRLAAECADIVSFSRDLSAGSTPHQIAVDASLESTEDKARILRGHLGARAAEVELNVLVIRAGVGSDAQAKLDQYLSDTGVSPQTARETPENLLGSSIDELVDLLQERRARTGISYYVLREPDLQLARLLAARLSGS
ncbi:putative F420-dependent oxidoreductase [Kitasatospora sp. MAP12-15]|uniref:TIGR03621 family F420-dependent LLM class oxidoreductase n=1 Tax=unclassified Kitasatospora TaxID=2633591 RepID=UPI002473227E|nr:TIGR03621 family F420-dependent LLM class oxidoreductase [Kitasatospora sp. MAP12-44]MDH6108190.1 putative F420-dependent oxidoreductase [Kitasatospora sp. MAP12-44]